MRMASWTYGLCVLAALALGGCAADHPHPTTMASAKADDCDCCAPGAAVKAATTLPSHAECLVCKANADLACVDIKVENDTPRTDYNGKTYFFCSDDCRKEFAKGPAKYTK